MAKCSGGKFIENFVLHSDGPTSDRVGSDCGFLLPRQLSAKVAAARHGDYWSGVMFHNIICISAHLLDHTSDSGRATKVYSESRNSLNIARYIVGIAKLRSLLDLMQIAPFLGHGWTSPGTVCCHL